MVGQRRDKHYFLVLQARQGESLQIQSACVAGKERREMMIDQTTFLVNNTRRRTRTRWCRGKGLKTRSSKTKWRFRETFNNFQASTYSPTINITGVPRETKKENTCSFRTCSRADSADKCYRKLISAVAGITHHAYSCCSFQVVLLFSAPGTLEDYWLENAPQEPIPCCGSHWCILASVPAHFEGSFAMTAL